MDNTMEFIYTSKEVSTSIGIATSTLRTWCLKLEASGYIFKRSNDGRRMFFERDIITLRMMKTLLDKEYPIELAVKRTVNKFNTMTHSVINDNNDFTKALDCTTLSSERFPNPIEFIQEMKRVIHEEVHQEVAAAMDRQNERLEEHIAQRDRQLMQILREMQEKHKKKWWKNLF